MVYAIKPQVDVYVKMGINRISKNRYAGERCEVMGTGGGFCITNKECG